jgi:hypothetical protein
MTMRMKCLGMQAEMKELDWNDFVDGTSIEV